MQNQKETTRINSFLTVVIPVVVDITKKILESLNFQVAEKGLGLDTVFTVKAGKKAAEFYLQNLFLEIATVDRDEQPLRFDENLRDFDYFLSKMSRTLASKLSVLLHLFGEDDIDAAIENIARDAKQYEHVRIWKFDPDKTEQSQDRKQSG